MTIRIGELRHRVAIQAYGDTPSGASSIVPSWETVGEAWARIRPVKGLVTFDTKQIGEAVTHEVIIRYNPSLIVTSEHWLLYGGWRYRVRNVRDLFERQRFLELMCEQEQAA